MKKTLWMSWFYGKNKPIRFWFRSEDPAYQCDTKRKLFNLVDVSASRMPFQFVRE